MKKELIKELVIMGYDVKDKNTTITVNDIIKLANKFNISGFKILELLEQ